MVVGSLVKTDEQTTVIAPFLIVIMASVGGIFIPFYLLPETLQNLSFMSPMYWAHTAFLDIFVRDAGLPDLAINLSKLLLFFAVTVLLSLMLLRRRRD